jgi:NitT/TauT family transport system substrate-binding protein
MSDQATRHEIRLAPNGPVFDLPIYVARDEGLFEKEGVSVKFVEKHDPAISALDPFERQKEALYESGAANGYNLCEWAGLDRSERSSRGSLVHSLRPAVAAQAILSFDDAIQEPRDLANVGVGINDRTGSHYTALQLLGGALPRNEVKLEHAGPPLERYKRLRGGSLRAVALMEPYISLALKEGAHIVALTFYRGSEVIAPDLPAEAREAYVRAVNSAAALIRADFAKYKHYVVEPVKELLAPQDLQHHFVRYAPSKAFDEARFEYTYEWMQSWDLTPGDKSYADLIA